MKRQKGMKFTLQPRQHIEVRMRKPQPTANTQKQYPRVKTRAMKSKYEVTSRGLIHLETLRQMRSDVAQVSIIENENGLHITVYYRDGTHEVLR